MPIGVMINDFVTHKKTSGVHLQCGAAFLRHKMEKMSKRAWILFVLLVATVFACFKTSTKDALKGIEISKVNFERTSIVALSCDDLGNYFKEQLETSVIQSQEELKTFSSYLDELMEEKEGYIPDVRAKVLIYKNDNRVDTLWLSNLGMVYNGVLMQVNPKIVEFIESH